MKFPRPSSIKEDIYNIIIKACDINPKNRYKNAAKMKEDLLKALNLREKKFVPYYSEKKTKFSNKDEKSKIKKNGTNTKKKVKLLLIIMLPVIVIGLIFLNYMFNGSGNKGEKQSFEKLVDVDKNFKIIASETSTISTEEVSPDNTPSVEAVKNVKEVWVEIPLLEGKTKAESTEILDALKIKYEIIKEYIPDEEVNLVIRTEPVKGIEVEENSTIKLYITKGCTTINGTYGSDNMTPEYGKNYIYPLGGNDTININADGSTNRIYLSTGNDNVEFSTTNGLVHTKTIIEDYGASGVKKVVISIGDCTKREAKYPDYRKIYIYNGDSLVHEIWLKEYTDDNKWIEIIYI